MNQELVFLKELIDSIKGAMKESPFTTESLVIGKNYRKIESKYRDYLDGAGEKPELDVSDSRIKCMLSRIELERCINERFVDGFRIFLRDNYGELEIYTMYELFSPIYGWDMVLCSMDDFYQEIVRIGIIKEDAFLKLCDYKPPKSRKRSH